MLLKRGLIDRAGCVDLVVFDRMKRSAINDHGRRIKWRRRGLRSNASSDRATGKTENVQLLIGYG